MMKTHSSGATLSCVCRSTHGMASRLSAFRAAARSASESVAPSTAAGTR